MNDRKELIARLRECKYSSLAAMYAEQAADMLEADAQRLSNLLARIHRDGGHYEVEHGTDKAVVDADLKVAQTYADLFELQQTATSDEWLTNCPQSVRDLANRIKAEMSVPQEPVAWQHRGRPAANREWGEWHTVGYKPKGPEDTRFMVRPLFAAPQPQRPRLSDGEVYTAYIEATNQTLRPQDERLAFAFARAIEKKVRGEA